MVRRIRALGHGSRGGSRIGGYLGGDPTAYRAGQVSLNPLPHIRREPFGMVVLPLVALFSEGWCLGYASTPCDPAWEQRQPRRAAWMAAAGPGANLLLGILAFIFLWLGLMGGFFFAPDSIDFSRLVASDAVLLDGLGRFLSIALLLNMVLFLLNLLPIPPLDGTSAMRLVLPGGAGPTVEGVRHPRPALHLLRLRTDRESSLARPRRAPAPWGVLLSGSPRG